VEISKSISFTCIFTNGTVYRKCLIIPFTVNINQSVSSVAMNLIDQMKRIDMCGYDFNLVWNVLRCEFALENIFWGRLQFKVSNLEIGLAESKRLSK
jgi:hypothetical protein